MSLSRPLNSSLLYQEHKKVPPGAQAARMDDLGDCRIRNGQGPTRTEIGDLISHQNDGKGRTVIVGKAERA